VAKLLYDVVIVGASLGGVSAALRAQMLGAQVCLLESSSWVGGQYTNQGVCKPDENKYIETVGSTASYRDFRHRCRAYYRNNFVLADAGASMPLFNAGGSWDANQPQFAFEPKVADTVLKRMLSDLPNVHVRLGMKVVDAKVEGNRILSITAVDAHGVETTFRASHFLDATDLGDLLPLVLRSDEWTVGAEAPSGTHEPSAPAAAHRRWIAPITFCIALEKRPSGDYTIPKPAQYEELKAEQRFTIVDGELNTMFDGDTWKTTMWNYRRYISAGNFNDPKFPYDLSMINTGSNDYQAASVPTGDESVDEAIIARARQAALAYLYWLQTECPRDGGSGSGYPELRPNPDAFGTADGVAPVPYIRESRRIVALERIVEQDVSQIGAAGPRAKHVPVSCGIGTYAFMDGHELKGATPPMPGFWINVYPTQIPTSALIPRRLENLIAACKNIGTTHLTNGLYRLHPFEWNIGESAGALAALASANNVLPRDAVGRPHLLRAYQRALVGAGVPLFWWTDVQYGDPLFESAQMAGATGTMSGDGNREMRFFPDTVMPDAERVALEQSVGMAFPASALSRRDAVQWLDAQGLV